jgi:single-strand DNA-binding protein
MASVNKSTILGRLGQDIELKYTAGGTPVAKISVATSKAWKDKDGKKQERTEWHRIVLFNKTAENANKYLKKGSQVYIEGYLQTNEWTDKESVKRWSTEIVAEVLQYLDSKPKDGDAGSTEQSKVAVNTDVPSVNTDVPSDDDIPF